jgi:calcineurin-like phosphoesterase
LRHGGVDVLTTGNHIWRQKKCVDSWQRTSVSRTSSTTPPALPAAGFRIVDRLVEEAEALADR